jgi:hypothetical protein
MPETPAPFPLPDSPPDPVAPWQPEPAEVTTPGEPEPAEVTESSPPAPPGPEPPAEPEPEPELDRFHGLEPAWLREALREVFDRLTKLEG